MTETRPAGTIVLAGMEFHAFHGVHDYELERGARFIVDVEIGVTPGEVDTLASTVDYSRVYRTVREVVTGRRFKLIESLAAAITRAVSSIDPQVTALVVRVHKPHAPLPGIVRDVYYEHRWARPAPP